MLGCKVRIVVLVGRPGRVVGHILDILGACIPRIQGLPGTDQDWKEMRDGILLHVSFAYGYPRGN